MGVGEDRQEDNILDDNILTLVDDSQHTDWQAQAMTDLLSRLGADDIHVHGDGVVDGKIILWCDHHRGMAITVNYLMASTMLAALDDEVKSPTVWSIIAAIKLKTPRQKTGG